MNSTLLFWVGLIFLVAAPLSFWFYTRLSLRLKREGGQIHSEELGLPDLLMSAVLGGTLAMIALLGFASAKQVQPPMGSEQVIAGTLFLVAIAVLVLVFMQVRRVRLAGVVNPSAVPAPRAFVRGMLLLLAALPVIGAFNMVAQLLPQDMLQEQEMVKLFGDVTKQGNLETVLLIVFAAVVVAPLCEEFIFRGYFYPVWKRYFGATPSAVLASTLFAIMHVNIASLPGLFGLAICLTICFEASGSLIVPIAMHALFNALSLTMLYLRAQGMI